MAVGNKRNPIGSLNVTPLIDVLLVLLIIFMVITPSRNVGFETTVPQQPTNKSNAPEPDRAIVIYIDRELKVTINSQPTDIDQLGSRLATILKMSSQRAVFIKADGDVEFRHVARAIDLVNGAGIDRIGLLGRSY